MIDYDKVTVPGIRLLVTQSVFVIKKKTKKIKATLIIYKLWEKCKKKEKENKKKVTFVFLGGSVTVLTDVPLPKMEHYVVR